jgi:phosphatidate cytidylyltransferase
MRNLLRRSFSGIVYVFIFVSAILFSKESFIVLTSIFAVICIWEFSRLIKLKNYLQYIIFGVLLFLLIRYKASPAVMVLLGLTILSSVQLIYKLFWEVEIKLNKDIAKLFLSTRYVIASLSFLILIPFVNGAYTPKILIGILLLIWTNDSFAFLVGKNIGRRKLFASVSPKKTIEGFIGGLFFALIVGYLVGLQTQLFSTIDWLIIAAIISIVGTIGDLVESKFKRQAKIKDSGNIMPGHGGLLDRLDSLLFAAPFVYLYIHHLI